MFAPQVCLRPDPDTRVESDGTITDLLAKDRDARTLLAQLPAVHAAGDVDLSGFTTETNQLSLNACAGNATADSIELLNDVEEKTSAQAEGREPAAPEQVSRMFIYNMARQRMGDLGQDQGTYIRACFDVLSRFGVCREETWPYDPAKVFTSPSLRAQQEAVGYRIHSYYKIKDSSDRLNQIVDALRANHPVVFGTQVTEAFMAFRGTTPWGRPSGALAGGHAMLIVGYLQGLGFLVKNSWGRTWGDKGFCIMKPEYLDWDQSFDFWVPTTSNPFV